MTQLTSFLDSGRPVYAEGGDFGFSNNGSELWPFFGTSYLGDGRPSSTGNVQSLAGESGSFAEGLSLGYAYQQGPDNYVDEMGAAGGAVILRSQDNVGRAVCNAASGYRTVLSATVFGAMSRTDRAALMAGYMDYLLLGAGISRSDAAVTAPATAVTPSVARVGRTVRLLTSGPARDLAVLDVAGRTVAGWRLAAGPGTTTWQVGPAVAPGAYFLQVRCGGRTDTRGFTVVH